MQPIFNTNNCGNDVRQLLQPPMHTFQMSHAYLTRNGPVLGNSCVSNMKGANSTTSKSDLVTHQFVYHRLWRGNLRCSLRIDHTGSQ